MLLCQMCVFDNTSRGNALAPNEKEIGKVRERDREIRSLCYY